MNTYFLVEREFIIIILFELIVLICVLYLLHQIYRTKKVRVSPLKLIRHPENPVLEPIAEHFWEAEAVFNPTVFYDGDRVHMFYRAVGRDGVSRVGYASSPDGINFDKRLPYPVYELRNDYQKQAEKERCVTRVYHPGIYASGGSWGGVEDPRVIKVEDDIYMTFTAFLGWNAVRMTLTSIPHSDILNEGWRWRQPSFLSRPNEVHKNWVIFPEKIDGKYGVLHSISPKVCVHYVDEIEELHDEDTFIDSVYIREERPDAWDTWMRGAGPPPLKTKDGWLVFYHAVAKDEPSKYKVGVMLLDLDDPTIVRYRAPLPLLEPDTYYENRGKPGVVYATGVTVMNEQLLVYYGGGDTSVNIASVPFDKFMRELKRHPERL